MRLQVCDIWAYHMHFTDFFYSCVLIILGFFVKLFVNGDGKQITTIGQVSLQIEFSCWYRTQSARGMNKSLNSNIFHSLVGCP
jgi:hypothetical protein